MEQIKVTPIKSLVSLADLAKIDIRVGTIELIEDVPGSDNLARLSVGFGDHKRKIVAGLKRERPNLKDLEGKQALFVVNLAPKTIRGEVSQGMLFDIGYDDGITPVLAVPEREVPDGSRAG